MMRKLIASLLATLLVFGLCNPASAQNAPYYNSAGGSKAGAQGTVIVTPTGVFCDFTSGGNCASSGSGGGGVAQGSTTSGQLGTLVQCAATTAAPTYVTGKTNPLSCDLSGNVRTTGTATVSGTIDENLKQVGGVTTPVGNGVTGTGSQRVTIASDNTAFGVNATLQTQADTTMVGGVNVKEFNGVTPLMGNGVSGTGSQRVNIASDNTAFGVNATLQTQADTTMVGGINVKEFNGVTPLMGNGVSGTGSQRVNIASDNTAFIVNPASATAPVSTMNSASANAGVTAAAAYNFDDASVTTITENNFGYGRMSFNRDQYMNIRDGQGNEYGAAVNSNHQLYVAAFSETAPVSTMNSASANAGVTAANAFVFDDASPTTITENSFGYARMSTNRDVYTNIRSGDGTEIGAIVDGSGQLKVAITGFSSTSPVTLVPDASSSNLLSSYVVEAAASDNHASIKTSAGAVFGLHAYNNSATVNYIRLYDRGAGFNACNSATGLIWEGNIPASTSGAGFNIDFGVYGILFGQGLAICITGGFGNTNTTSATASAISANVLYK